MIDRYASFAQSGPGRFIVRRLGLPDPYRLYRYSAGATVASGRVLLGGGGSSRLAAPVRKILESIGADVTTGRPPGSAAPPSGDGADTGGWAALVYDASAATETEALRGLYDFFHPAIRGLAPSGRVVVLGTPPELCPEVRESTAQRALEGFVRSLAKEVGHGSTAQLLYVEPGGEDALESTLRFLLSPRSAYVSGQEIRVGQATVECPEDWERPLEGKVALVTGAARGIGEATARLLARDGAHVICVDVPSAGEALTSLADEITGTPLQLDLTDADAPRRIGEFIATRHVHADVFVHNAGVSRDRTIARMSPQDWSAVLDVNLASQERINDVLIGDGLLGSNGRLISVASVAGIAGNRGQTNYATSKAGVIGLVRALAPALAKRGITVNGVAPGFIETSMTATMPIVLREAGRRMNSLGQAGMPVDVAETIGWLANPASSGVTGNVVRVCGQSILGA
ncbi:MAG TPA: 3-oxoacyl-ACP reductase [Micromonosporaceae bacterium]|nr:3-oxoacyl-ACP reductase [Micromonosporaceae bacterium]